MKKYLLGALIAVILTVSTPTIAQNAISFIKFKLNGNLLNQHALLFNGTVYVPLKNIGETLKMNATYDKASKTVSISGSPTLSLSTATKKDPNKVGPDWFKSSGMVEMEWKKYRAGFVLSTDGKFYLSSIMIFDAYPLVKDYANSAELDTKVYKNVAYISLGEAINILNECGVNWNIAIFHEDSPDLKNYQ